ncbi:Stage III sporulation protein AA [Proteiniborus sp. DW1]|uniref:stage III sporulation protein AA n=1 Tax=Proteiniborus sp. DW1 TaxID=1889883 RepID=UPI00092DFD29|nr:stage III sporulation protein AA [Proteiniborus sp. DW1]SCG83303.1 Stage III sporulation protein AA [Proteiniborus sp. DW1]
MEVNNNFIKSIQPDKINAYKEVLNFIDPELTSTLSKLPKSVAEKIEEIRLRNGKPLMISLGSKDYFVTHNGTLEAEPYNCITIDNKHISRTFQLISNYSIYSIEEELRNGFITVRGGHRVGITGKVVYGPNGVESIRDVSSLNLRIAKEIIGVSNDIMRYIIRKPNTIYNTLLVSPPQCGKTTLLRDIIRNISNGIPSINFRGLKVGVVDERSELGGSYKGCPQNDVGVRTDIIDSCRKHEGIMLLLRSMSPNVIATDEIGDEKDIKAIHEAIKAGVKIISTVHGDGISDILSKPKLKVIISEKVFERIIIIDNENGVGSLQDILDGNSFKSVLR